MENQPLLRLFGSPLSLFRGGWPGLKRFGNQSLRLSLLLCSHLDHNLVRARQSVKPGNNRGNAI